MKHFSGSPERVVNYFKFIAQEVREIMASLVIKTIDELTGQTHLLSISKGITEKHKALSLKKMLQLQIKNQTSIVQLNQTSHMIRVY